MARAPRTVLVPTDFPSMRPNSGGQKAPSSKSGENVSAAGAPSSIGRPNSGGMKAPKSSSGENSVTQGDRKAGTNSFPSFRPNSGGFKGG